MCPAPLDASRRELFIRIFKSVAALSVLWRINVLCVCTRRPIQLQITWGDINVLATCRRQVLCNFEARQTASQSGTDRTFIVRAPTDWLSRSCMLWPQVTSLRQSLSVTAPWCASVHLSCSLWYFWMLVARCGAFAKSFSFVCQATYPHASFWIKKGPKGPPQPWDQVLLVDLLVPWQRRD